MIARPTVVCIAGGPGTGRTTLARSLLGDLDAYERTKPLRWTVRADGQVAGLGWYSGHRFDGGDRVPREALGDTLFAIELYADARLVIVEGRAAVGAFVDRMRKLGELLRHRIACVQLVAAPRIMRERREAISVSICDRIAKGQTTIAEQHARQFDDRLVIYTGDKTTGRVHDEARAFLKG